MPAKQGRKALGKGLDALLSVTSVPVRESSSPVFKSDEEISEFGSLRSLPIEEVEPCPNQPRRHFSEEEISELASSIEESGVLQPIVVRPSTGGMYEIVAGERRYRAAKQAGLSRIPAVVRELEDKEAFLLSVVENVQREDLNPIEEALAYQRLADEFDDSTAEVAERIGKNRSTVANSLRLLNLDSEVQKLIQDGKVSAGHGRALLQLSDKAAQRRLALRVIRDQMSVREIEKLVSSGKPQRTKKVVEKSPAVTELENRLRRHLGTKVSLEVARSGAGELRVSFYSEEELTRVLEQLGLA